MSEITSSTIAYQTAIERLRQESETFDQLKTQSERWFRLRLCMGAVAVVLLPSIAALSGMIILNPLAYSTFTVGAASTALLSDVLGLLIGVWRLVLNPDSVAKLSPVTGQKVEFDSFVGQAPTSEKAPLRSQGARRRGAD